MPTVEFICRTLAEWFEEPCNYLFGGIEAKDRVDDDEWCEEHCGNIAEWECWKKLFEAEAKRCDVNLFQNGNSSEIPNNCEPQTDCGDFADRLAYERGVKHAWEVAQKVFNSTVTFYEAEDVAKQIAKTEPQTYITEDRDTQILDAWQVHHRTSTTAVEDEPQTETSTNSEKLQSGVELKQTDCAWK